MLFQNVEQNPNFRIKEKCYKTDFLKYIDFKTICYVTSFFIIICGVLGVIGSKGGHNE